MKFFLDTEFQDHGKGRIDLISIGVVDQTGRTFYRASSEYDEDMATDWLRKNVLVHLHEEAVERETPYQIASELLHFVEGDNVGKGAWDGSEIEFWAWYADYDFVLMSGLHGPLIRRPKGWPMYCRDLKQYADSLGNPRIPKLSQYEADEKSVRITVPNPPRDWALLMGGEGAHDALYDAVTNLHRYNWLTEYERELWQNGLPRVEGV